MSFPWKKVKKTSVCELVKDHIRFHRNGGSPLIVETGFPTSLIDLFVKNRQRFIKPSKKKVAKSTLSSPSYLNLHLPFPMSPPSPATYTINKGSQLKGCQEKGERFDVDTNQVLIALVKIFLVVVLVLGAKNFVMGITMSACLFLFLEYSGEYLYKWLMPCVGAQRRILLTVQWVWRFIGGKMIELEEEEEQDDCVFEAQLQQKELANLHCSYMANQCVKEKTYESSRDRKLDEGMDSEGKEEELRTELLEFKKKKSHKSNMKSKMKKFLSKKFRKKISSMIVK
ncbi:PREDICTED: uncharacterized protein LOC109219041 [Nicotiana attenuata]|uniref:Uncharacterized protein n=1 Tax=Nicotiana attenuata TaxID=49451 RepID=A0A1J6IN70_NICAT|nr:PREDICTED: uncharacterized protein LOC109219041 [Nicotiana attenuata]OIT06138.1 hypothetical protein A4A49_05579 [Nicotiana attenuata]